MGDLPAGEGHQKLDLAARLGIESVPNRSVWQPALTRALTSGAAVYDTLFIELAAQRSLPLATFDKNVGHAAGLNGQWRGFDQPVA